MSGCQGDSWDPGQDNQASQKKNKRKAKPSRDSDRPYMTREELSHCADDQIAPYHVSNTISDLHRWAVATADIPQQGYLQNERPAMNRIQRRYANIEERNPHAPFPRYSNSDREKQAMEANSNSSRSKDAMKRRHSLSPPGLDRETWRMSAVMYIREAKRARERSPSPKPLRSLLKENRGSNGETSAGDDMEYAQSSDWSFPSSEAGQDFISLT